MNGRSTPEVKTADALAACWRLRWSVLSLDRPRIMGILNVTPDSFSDGGLHATVEQAVACGLAMIREGADILDIGGESTRPGADPVAVAEECRRVVPVLRALKERCVVPLSIDTRKPEVAEAALDAGAEIVNDVSALEDGRMSEVVALSGAGVVLMHSRGSPQTMSKQNRYARIARQVAEELAFRADVAQAQGISRDRICLDPGFGFAKVGMQNYALLREMAEIMALGYPVMVGASRKSFIGQVISTLWGMRPEDTPAPHRPPRERLAGSLAFAMASLAQGARIFRVHDVAETCDALRVGVQCWPGGV